MKQARLAIVQWVAKVFHSAQVPISAANAPTALRPLDAGQLRQVAGGTETSTSLPNRGW